MVGEHELKGEQRYETGHGVSEHGERAPYLFALDHLLIEQERYAESAEVVEESGHHRPQQVPAEYLDESRTDRPGREKLTEVLEPYPTDERARQHDIAAVICEREEYHEHYRQDIEHEHADDGQDERGHVEIFIEHARKRLTERRRRIAAPDVVECALRVAYVSKMNRDKESRYYKSQRSEQHHYNGVVALYVEPRVGGDNSEREKVIHRLAAREYHIDDIPGEHQQKQYAFDHLFLHYLPDAHKTHRRFDGTRRVFDITPPVGYARRHFRELCAQPLERTADAFGYRLEIRPYSRADRRFAVIYFVFGHFRLLSDG